MILKTAGNDYFGTCEHKKQINRPIPSRQNKNKQAIHRKIMSVEVVSAIDQMLMHGIIVSEQRTEVLRLFLDLQEQLKSADIYKLLEPTRKTIPPEILKLGSITYEDALLLTWAVQLSNVKRAGGFFNI